MFHKLQDIPPEILQECEIVSIELTAESKARMRCAITCILSVLHEHAPTADEGLAILMLCMEFMEKEYGVKAGWFTRKAEMGAT